MCVCECVCVCVCVCVCSGWEKTLVCGECFLSVTSWWDHPSLGTGGDNPPDPPCVSPDSKINLLLLESLPLSILDYY